MTRRIPAFAAVLFLSLATIPGAAQDSAVASKKPAPEILPLSEVRPGMKGYGLSVFQGSKVEKFNVEVISVLPKYWGDKDIIMVRVTHPVTDHALIIHGMSGSPIYFDGKLAGALSLGFSGLPKDPIAGITPIEYMLADKDQPWENEDAFLPPLPPESPFRYCRTPLMVSGIPPQAFPELKKFFEPLGFTVVAGGAGRMALDEDLAIEPGGSVGITLLSGDINFDGIGTVSYVHGKDVLVFGHMMFNGGQIELPMTTAWVHTVIADQSYSFKMASSAKTVGCMLKDRTTSCYGELGKAPPMAPLTVEVENAQTNKKKTFNFEMARHPLYTPYIVAQIPGYCVQLAEAGDSKDTTIEYSVHLKFEGFPVVELNDVYVSTPVGFSRGGGFEETLFELIGNSFRKVRLERADVKMTIVHRRLGATIEGVWPETRRVKPGESLKLTVHLRPYNKEAVKETIEVPIPAGMPDGEFEIAVMGGREATGGMDMQAMVMALLRGGGGGREEPQSFEELLDRIRRRQPADRLIAQVELPTLGVRHKDKKLENLPGSIFVNLVSNASAGLRIERDLLRIHRETDWVIEGRKSVKFEVRTPGRAETTETK